MSQKRPRILLLAAAFVAAVVVAYQCGPTEGPEPGTTPEPGAPPASNGGGGAFQPPDRAAGTGTGGTAAADAPIDVDPDNKALRRKVGPNLPDGKEVGVAVPYRKGAEAKYEIRRTMVQQDRNTGQTVAKQDLYGITFRVVEGDGTGAARVRLTIDWMGLKAIRSNGVQYQFDTRQPDDRQLLHSNVGYEIAPRIEIVGLPIELEIDATGQPTGVDGADRWAEAWEEVVERMEPGGSRKMPNPYSDERVMLTWSTWLFPPVGGGTMTTGEPRTIELLEDYGNAHYVSHIGPLAATHDDGTVFRVRFLTKAGLKPRQGASRSPAESAVARVHVQSDADAVHAAWRFDRKLGLLQDSEVDANFQMWTSYRVGGSGDGAPPGGGGAASDYQRIFLNIVHHTQVERVDQPK